MCADILCVSCAATCVALVDIMLACRLCWNHVHIAAHQEKGSHENKAVITNNISCSAIRQQNTIATKSSLLSVVGCYRC